MGKNVSNKISSSRRHLFFFFASDAFSISSCLDFDQIGHSVHVTMELNTEAYTFWSILERDLRMTIASYIKNAFQ